MINELLDEIRAAKNQRQAAEVYCRLIKHNLDDAANRIPVELVNDAICARWSATGLVNIQRLAREKRDAATIAKIAAWHEGE